jgi:hypothetical protein
MENKYKDDEMQKYKEELATFLYSIRKMKFTNIVNDKYTYLNTSIKKPQYIFVEQELEKIEKERFQLGTELVRLKIDINNNCCYDKDELIKNMNKKMGEYKAVLKKLNTLKNEFAKFKKDHDTIYDYMKFNLTYDDYIKNLRQLYDLYGDIKKSGKTHDIKEYLRSNSYKLIQQYKSDKLEDFYMEKNHRLKKRNLKTFIVTADPVVIHEKKRRHKSTIKSKAKQSKSEKESETKYFIKKPKKTIKKQRGGDSQIEEIVGDSPKSNAAALVWDEYDSNGEKVIDNSIDQLENNSDFGELDLSNLEQITLGDDNDSVGSNDSVDSGDNMMGGGDLMGASNEYDFDPSPVSESLTGFSLMDNNTDLNTTNLNENMVGGATMDNNILINEHAGGEEKIITIDTPPQQINAFDPSVGSMNTFDNFENSTSGSGGVEGIFTEQHSVDDQFAPMQLTEQRPVSFVNNAPPQQQSMPQPLMQQEIPQVGGGNYNPAHIKTVPIDMSSVHMQQTSQQQQQQQPLSF